MDRSARRILGGLALDGAHGGRDLLVAFLAGGVGVALNVSSVLFGLRPSGATFAHALLHATLSGPKAWTGGTTATA